MTMAMDEAVAIMAEEKAAEKPPRLIMAGIRMMPRAATVAGPEPEMAPKKQATTTQTMAMPPLRWPMQSSMNWTRRVEMPALAMMLPESTKNGMASSRNLAMLLYTLVGTTDSLSPENSMANTELMPRLTQMGMFKNSITKKLPNRIRLIIAVLLSRRQAVADDVVHKKLNGVQHQENGADGQKDGEHPLRPVQGGGVLAGAHLVDDLVKARLDEDAPKTRLKTLMMEINTFFAPVRSRS